MEEIYVCNQMSNSYPVRGSIILFNIVVRPFENIFVFDPRVPPREMDKAIAAAPNVQQCTVFF